MKIIKYFFTILLVLLCFSTSNAQLRLPRLIRDSMILQRDVPVKIWGWASKKGKIKVAFNQNSYKTVADTNGNWSVILPATKAGGPFTITIVGDHTIELKEILFGDVWICSGQSNMVHQMELHSVRYANEVASANNPLIRHFWVPNLADMQKPQDDLVNGFWKSANPKDINEFSAAAYFFAVKIYEQYHIPIGLINASVGGTPIEAWISEEGLKDFPFIQNTIQKNKDTAYINSSKRLAANLPQRPKSEDKGLLNKWYDPNYIPKGWHNITVPGFWEDQGVRDLDGVVWYRKEFEIPKTMSKNAARLFLGRIVDADNVYINGTAVGNTTYMYPQRRYSIPAGLLQEGKNLIVVKIQNSFGKGGFVPDKPYYLFAGKDTIDLKGYWQYKVGEVYTPMQRGMGNGGISAINQPTALYNAMIAPFINYANKGILWYQGESNTGRANEYTELQNALIRDWRKKWNNPTTPFLYVQLPGFMDMSYLPSESQWAQFRQAQLQSLSMPNTGMAVAIDLGEWNDIHPDRKKEVGDRLALLARKIVYHENELVYSGPLYQSSSIDGNKIMISFTQTGSGLSTSDGEELTYFAIAGEDKKFVWAKASIQGNKVVVWNENISNPKYVRYGWADNPDGANLCNKEGLPASPFTNENF